MSRFAPTWALVAAATDAAGDPHLAPGAHLRVMPGKELGLPVAPLLVEKHVVGDARRVGTDDDVVWVDAHGQQLSVPFDLDETGPATGRLPLQPGNPVLYAEVVIEPTDKDGDYDEWRRKVGRLAVPAVARGLRLPGALRADVLGHWPWKGRGARVDAVVSGKYGDSVVASADTAPYRVCATGMERLHVTGSGRVVGVRVLRLGDLKLSPPREEGWLLALPVDQGRRYVGLSDPESPAADRVLRGSPQLVGLHDDPTAPDPASCPGLSSGDELDRVTTVYRARVRELLDVVLNDTSDRPQAVMLPPESLAGLGAGVNPTVKVPALAGVLQAAVDPSMGRWLGLVEHDDAPGDPEELVVYVVRGAWIVHDEPSLPFPGFPFPSLPVPSLTTMLGGPDDPGAFPLPVPEDELQEPGRRFLDLWTAAAMVVGSASATVQPPHVDPGEHLEWIDADTRHVVLPLRHLVAPAQLAVARETPMVHSLNPWLPDLLGAGPDRAVAIVPGTLAEIGGAPAAAVPGQGEVHDRLAPAIATSYRVAQMDWFGRWSGWSSGSAAPHARPLPPTPFLEASYVDPAVPGDPGTVEVRCVQPKPADLALGALPLRELRLTVTVQPGNTVTVRVPVPLPADPDPTHAQPPVASVQVPGLAPRERRPIPVSGWWVDEALTDSREARTAVEAVDPRAPQPLVLPDTLEYATRPDALGRCRVDLRWTAEPRTAFRVYASDETTLRRRLDALVAQGNAGAQACVAALGNAHGPAARAGVFRQHAAVFDRGCFELLTPTPTLCLAGGPQAFNHEVSGSLRVLMFYKVLPVSVLSTGNPLVYGGEARFADSTLLVRGIPNSAPPPVPSLTVEELNGAARLRVTVPPGQTAPVAVRIRRSRLTAGDPLAMPVVRTVTPDSWPAVLDDTGPTTWDPAAALDPWATFTWVVEVQGAPEPGSSVPGLWSRPSLPASLRLLPDPPGPVTPVSVVGGTVTFQYAGHLHGQPVGEYRFGLYRVDPDPAVPTVTQEVEAGASGGPFTLTDTVTPPAGTRYYVDVVDPLGRRGPSTLVGTVS